MLSKEFGLKSTQEWIIQSRRFWATLSH